MGFDKWKVPAVGLLCLGLGAAGVYAKGAKQEYVMVPAGTAKWMPIDAKQPKGGQFAIIAGDPAAGPVTVMLKLPKGPAPIHWHSSDYSAVVVEGTTKHWLNGKEADAKALGAGTAWFQPGGSAATAHGDECTSESCTIFIVMPGKFDMMPLPATPPAKK